MHYQHPPPDGERLRIQHIIFLSKSSEMKIRIVVSSLRRGIMRYITRNLNEEIRDPVG